MKIKKSSGKLVLSPKFLHHLFGNSRMIARKLEFDYVKQALTITRGKLKGKKNTVPFSSIRKVYHRIYGQEDNFIVDQRGNNSGGQSSLSIVFLDITDMPNETIYMESYERAGKATKEARQIISRIQGIVDEIAHFIWKPVVIECKEIGFFVDMEKRLMLFRGQSIPLSNIWLVQTVETDRGYYAVEVYTSAGDAYLTAEGLDKTIHISDTVKLVTDRAGLSYQLVRNRDNHYPFGDLPYQEKFDAPNKKDKARMLVKRLLTDGKEKGNGKVLEAKGG